VIKSINTNQGNETIEMTIVWRVKYVESSLALFHLLLHHFDFCLKQLDFSREVEEKVASFKLHFKYIHFIYAR
jgi:hypothetical protein